MEPSVQSRTLDVLSITKGNDMESATMTPNAPTIEESSSKLPLCSPSLHTHTHSQTLDRNSSFRFLFIPSFPTNHQKQFACKVGATFLKRIGHDGTKKISKAIAPVVGNHDLLLLGRLSVM